MMRILESPLSKDVIRSLKLGEIVYINGPVITGRDEMHIRAIEKARKGEPVPEEITGSVLYHCGPIMTEVDGKKEVVASGNGVVIRTVSGDGGADFRGNHPLGEGDFHD